MTNLNKHIVKHTDKYMEKGLDFFEALSLSREEHKKEYEKERNKRMSKKDQKWIANKIITITKLYNNPETRDKIKELLKDV